AGSPSGMLTVASNCTVTSTNPQTVTVTAGSTASASFTVNCPTPPTTGDLMVSNTTTGSSAPASYTVTVDAGTVSARTRTMAPGGSVTFTDLPAGSHSVTLTVASNCTVTSTNPQTVTVTAGSTASASFTVNCPTPPTGPELTGTGQIGTRPATAGHAVPERKGAAKAKDG